MGNKIKNIGKEYKKKYGKDAVKYYFRDLGLIVIGLSVFFTMCYKIITSFGVM